MQITTRMIKLLSPAGFSELYDHALRENPHLNREQCYEKLEKEHEGYFKKRRYSSYDSFRKVRERRYKQGS